MTGIIFDVRANHDTGVSRYGLSLLAHSAPILCSLGWDVTVLARREQMDRVERATADLPIEVETPEDEGFVRCSQSVRAIIARKSPDLYYTSHYTIDRLCTIPFVYTVHDLTRLKFPDLTYDDRTFSNRFGSDELRLVREELRALEPAIEPASNHVFNCYFLALNRSLAGRARRVATVSKATRSDLVDLLDVAPDRIHLVPCATDGAVFHACAAERIAEARSAYAVDGPYLIFVGLAAPHKRFPWLVEQLVRHRDWFPPRARLVVVGGHGEHCAEVRAHLRAARAEDMVVFTGRVTDDDLAKLYAGAAAFVTASLNEGNNIPPMEAIACGTQVIATDIAPLRETLGGGAHFYDPADPAGFARMAADALHGRLRDRASRFVAPTWGDAAQALNACLRSSLRGHP